ncbi:MAG TPA: hypothetical protein VN698_13030 [Bacteroidia bacterium]|nr:hypothetical protein [Bacteroidia bacterium]
MTNDKKITILFKAALSVIIIAALAQCKKNDDATPSGSTGSTISNSNHKSDTSSVSASYGSLAFQGTTYTIKGGCYTTDGKYNVRGSSSSYDLAIEFPNGKPTANTTINFPSTEIQITEAKSSSNIWTPVSGSATVNVNQQGSVTVSFDGATFSNSKKSNTQATASVTCQ